MKCLLVIEDALLRDQIEAGLRSCPGFSATTWSTRESVEILRANWDCIWVEMGKDTSVSLLNEIRSRNEEAFLMVLAEHPVVKRLNSSKDHWRITSFVELPLDAKDFFNCISRLRARLKV